MKIFLAFNPFGHARMAFGGEVKLVKFRGAELFIIDRVTVRS